MRKNLVFLCVFVVLSRATSFAEVPLVTLQNQEPSDFWFVVDPGELSGLTPGSPFLASRVAEFFARQAEEPAFERLGPEESTRLEGLSEGAHLLVGYFAVEGAEEFPVRVATLQADSGMGERFYAITDTPVLVSVPPGVGRLAAFAKPPSEAQSQNEGAGEETAAAPSAMDEAQAEPPVTAQEPPAASLETAAAPGGGGEQAEPATATVSAESPALVERAQKAVPLAIFSDDYDPGIFTRESDGEFAVLPLSDSIAWNLAGLRIAEIDGSVTKNTLTFSLSVAGGFSDDVSYFLYVFPNRAAGRENRFTLELRVPSSGDRGACILWERSSPAPSLLGAVKITGPTCAFTVGFEQVPLELLTEIGDTPTVDLTACWYNRLSRSYEEFYYTTFSLADLSVTR
jgi:hypothetical protein